MAEERWYNKLVARLIQERQMSEYAVAKAAGLSPVAVRNARTGKHYVSMETIEKVLFALGFRMEAVLLPPPPEKKVEVVLPTKRPKPIRPERPEVDSFCWACGGTDCMLPIHGHLQCNRCGYIDPCCED